MKKFLFQLQAALDMRRRREEHLRGELAEMQARRTQEMARLDDLLASRDVAMGRAAEGRVGRIEPETSRSYERRLVAFEDAIIGQRDLLDLIQREMDRKVAEVVAATQETRALEKLRERHQEEHRRVELHEEQKFLDELASIRSALSRATA